MSHPGPKSLNSRLQNALDARKARSVYRQLTIAPPNALDFSSNDFLSLAHSPALRAAFDDELARTDGLPLGSGGSRLLDGNSAYPEQLEHDIAAFHGAEAGLLFNSGFDANSGIFSCIPQRGDAIIYDDYIHASVHEGMRLSRASRTRSFAHNSLDDFARVLEETISASPSIKSGSGQVYVAVEAVYSMDGDVAPITAILDALEYALPEGNGHLIVDEAHSTGVYGPSGRGVVSALAAESRVLLRLHTFGKALAANGAIVLCSPLIRQYLINYARPLIYTTAAGLPSLAAVAATYALMRAGSTQALQSALWSLVAHFHARMDALRPRTAGHVTLAPVPPKSPIFALITPDPRALAAWCQRGGCVVRAIMPPTVPDGTQRVRVCLHAGNTVDQVERLVGLVVAWCEERERARHHGALDDGGHIKSRL